MTGDLTVQRLDDAAAFLAATEQLRSRDPILTNVLASVSLAVVAGRRYDGAAWWLVRDTTTGSPGEVVGAAMLTPPFPLTVSPMPDVAARALGLALRDEAARGALAIAEIGGPPEAAVAVAAAVVPGAVPVMEELVHVLDVLTPATGVPGGARPAARDDIDLVRDWLADFAAEAGVPPSHDDDALRARLDTGSLLLWLDAHGTPVSLAGHAPPVAAPTGTVVRIGPVWTPPQHRRQGYAAAVTGHVAAQLASTGATVMLFTDASNPTSNGVYARLGFRVVGAWVQLALA